MQLTISKWGNSSAIRLPKQLVTELKLHINDSLSYEVKDNKIILKKISTIPDLTIADLFEDYDGEPVNTKPLIFSSEGEEQW